MSRLVPLMLGLLLSACASNVSKPTADHLALALDVAAIENAFAATMAARDFAAFSSFLADDTVFMNGKTPLHGKAAVEAAWKRYYESPQAPFSWRSAQVQVLDSGDLALSQGPVLSADGKQIGNFNSVWRRQANGQWKIVFDHGSDHCPKSAD